MKLPGNCQVYNKVNCGTNPGVHTSSVPIIVLDMFVVKLYNKYKNTNKEESKMKQLFNAYRTNKNYCPKCGELFGGWELYGTDECHMMCMSCVPQDVEFSNKMIMCDD